MSPPIRVVAAIILQKDSRFLIARKKPGMSMAGYWEFPGGKVHAGEEETTALMREIKEELNVQLKEIQFCFAYPYSYPDKDIEFAFYTASIDEEVITSTDHDAFAWIHLVEQREYIFAPADTVALQFMERLCI